MSTLQHVRSFFFLSLVNILRQGKPVCYQFVIHYKINRMNQHLTKCASRETTLTEDMRLEKKGKSSSGVANKARGHV